VRSGIGKRNRRRTRLAIGVFFQPPKAHLQIGHSRIDRLYDCTQILADLAEESPAAARRIVLRIFHDAPWKTRKICTCLVAFRLVSVLIFI
jgi:hypothetical protein